MMCLLVMRASSGCHPSQLNTLLFHLAIESVLYQKKGTAFEVFQQNYVKCVVYMHLLQGYCGCGTSGVLSVGGVIYPFNQER